LASARVRIAAHFLPWARWWPIWFLLGLSVLVGAATANAPVVAWLVIAATAGIVLVQMPVDAWVWAAVLLSVGSRLAVATGMVPQIVNFLHFPLALGAALVAAVNRGDVQARLRSKLALGLTGLLAVSLGSWVANGGEMIRPILAWLVFAEPFLLVYAILKIRGGPRGRRRLLSLLMTLAFIQLPLAVWQFRTLGLGDPVQGTFVGLGAGAHVAGAVALLGTMVLVARVASRGSRSGLPVLLLGGSALAIVSFLADAKQAFAAFLAGAMYLVWTSGFYGRGKFLLLPVLVLGGAALATSSFPAFGQIFNVRLLHEGASGKISAYGIISGGGLTPRTLLGLGPGNSVSRVSLMGVESYVKPQSPVSLLGLTPAPATQEILALAQSNWLIASSSAWSGISSWLGLFGDLGLVGVAVYLWLCVHIWRALGRVRTWQSQAARASLVMAALLGGIYSWLEEPGFTMVVALLVGLALIPSHDGYSTTHRPARP